MQSKLKLMRVARDALDELRRISVDVDRSMCGAKPTQAYEKGPLLSLHRVVVLRA